MAINLKQVVSFSLGATVDSAVDAVRTLRTSERARKEAAFQTAIADGMPYEEQIKYREEQLAEERSSGFVDEDYITKLTTSIGDLKKLNRFNTYRTKYAEALGEMNDGQINAVQYRKQLEDMLRATEDPDLRLEIQGNIASADAAVQQYRDTILANKVKKAQYDGTTKVLDKTIKEVKAARARAALGKNEDEVTEYDATLSALTSQLTQARVEDVVNDITVAGAVGVHSSKSKLDTINSQLDDADDSIPVTIGGKRYNSEREYWEVTRGAYLSGTGTGVFSDYFGELSNSYKDKIDGASARYGFVPADTINSIKGDFDTMLTRPEFAPYAAQVQSLQSQAVAAAANTMANTIVDRATYSGDFRGAEQSLKQLATTYGIDTSAYQLKLGGNLNQQINAAISAGSDPGDVEDLLPATDFKTPTALPAAPAAAPNAAAPSGAFKLPGGGTIEVDNVTGRKFQYDANGMYKGEYFGEMPKPNAAPAPAAPATPTPKVDPKKSPAPAPAPKAQPTVAPVVAAPAIKPVTPAPAAGGAYNVAAGDTLSGLAKARGTTVADILKKNPGITDPNKIRVGQKINF